VQSLPLPEVQFCDFLKIWLEEDFLPVEVSTDNGRMAFEAIPLETCDMFHCMKKKPPDLEL
jgi:hypothetical protein